jgi:hypothetical protein
MKSKLLIILAIALFSCEKDEPVTAAAQTYCMCGEITNINQFYPDLFFTYTLKNKCTGNTATTTSATYFEEGNDMCLTYEW